MTSSLAPSKPRPCFDPRTEAPPPDAFETVNCLACSSTRQTELLHAHEDLTGKPGRFRFVRCDDCGLAFQSPRLRLEHIGSYYDDEYLAHRKRRDFGLLSPVVEWAMGRHDVRKLGILERHLLLRSEHDVLDVGCGAGTFLELVRKRYGARTVGVDFKDLRASPAFQHSELKVGLLYEQDFGTQRFDLVTMWHFLEHDYDPARTLNTAHELLRPGGRLVIEVPQLGSRSARWFGDRWPGLQAPQHTTLFDRSSLTSMAESCGLEVVEWLPWGAFPAYFYLYAGRAFRRHPGRGLDLDRIAVPYFLGQLLLSPVLAFERRLNLAMQTLVCRRPA